MTNAEKIKAMSIDELAEYIGEFCDCDYCHCPINNSPVSCVSGCVEAWRKYLSRETDE